MNRDKLSIVEASSRQCAQALRDAGAFSVGFDFSTALTI
jgi:hypothetical protein